MKSISAPIRCRRFLVSAGLVIGTLVATALPAMARDQDGDGVEDERDNCPGCFNPAQTDRDRDGLGDCWRCDWCDGPGTDSDWDTLCDDVDNCPFAWNQSQRDRDRDGLGDACDPEPQVPNLSLPDAGTSAGGSSQPACRDDDRDQICDAEDNCKGCANPDQADRDRDGLGDCWRCDWCDGPGTDSDWDGICDDVDNCPLEWNQSQADRDCDGLGNVCDPAPATPANAPSPSCPDADQDGICDAADHCPLLANPDPTTGEAAPCSPASSSNSSTTTACVDADEDNVCDDVDNCLGCANPDQTDADQDGLGDCWRCDWCAGPGTDGDWDGWCDEADNCPTAWNESQRDTDGDGRGDACDDTPSPPASSTETSQSAAGPSSTESPSSGAWTPPADSSCTGRLTRYPAASSYSPITCGVQENLQKIAARHPERAGHVFMKVGDSISAGHEFMSCFATENVDLEAMGYGRLNPTWTHFQRPLAVGGTSFARNSAATESSRTAKWAREGAPSPLQREIAALNPRYAFVMFGTNDIHYGGATASADLKFPWMFEHLRALIDELITQGVVPMLYTIPPNRGSSMDIRRLVASYNVIVRALAESRQIPLVDYYQEMLRLPNWGLRDDGVHPSALYGQLCNFRENGLAYGYNLRNLLTLNALERVWQATEGSVTASSSGGAPALSGTGTPTSPFRVDQLPFAVVHDLRDASSSTWSSYGCGAQLSGKEQVYRVELAAPTALRVMVVQGSEANADVVWLSAPETASCQKRADTMLRGTFPAGTHYFSVDAPTASKEGEYVFVVAPCAADDGRCASAP